MLFSKTYTGLLLLGAIPIIIGGLIGRAFEAFIIYNALILALLVIDLIITPGKNDFEIVRQCDEKLSLGASNKIIISIRNKSKFVVKLEIRDEVPSLIKVENENLKVQAIPHSEEKGWYTAIPQKRGEFSFGKINIRFNGVLRLCQKKFAYAAESNYKVYPNLKDLRKNGLRTINRSQLLYGSKKSRTYSMGTEFESLREYSEGDEYRKINWLATARSNKLIVNTFEPERNQQVFILIDSSRVMNSEINHIKKLDYAVNAAFLLADAALRKGDRAGLMVFDSQVRRYIKPGKGAGYLELLAENLYDVSENLVTANYVEALIYLNQQQKRRSLLCIFTELFTSDEALRLAATLKTAAGSHVPLVITIKDLRLYETAAQKAGNIEDIYTKSAAIKLVEEREKIRRILTDSQIACVDAAPDKLSAEVVNKYLNMKAMVRF